MRLLAYIDPGFGSIVFQSLVAGLVGMTFFFRTIRMKVTSFFSSMFGRADSNKTDDPKP